MTGGEGEEHRNANQNEQHIGRHEIDENPVDVEVVQDALRGRSHHSAPLQLVDSREAHGESHQSNDCTEDNREHKVEVHGTDSARDRTMTTRDSLHGLHRIARAGNDAESDNRLNDNPGPARKLSVLKIPEHEPQNHGKRGGNDRKAKAQSQRLLHLRVGCNFAATRLSVSRFQVNTAGLS